MTFLVTYRNYLENTTVHTFDGATEAKVWLDAQNDQAMSGRIISEPLDIDGSKKYMIDLFNALAREGDEALGPTGFNNRATGQTRVFDRLVMYYANLPVTAAPAAGATEQQAPAVEPDTDTESSAPEQQKETIDMATKAKSKAKKTKTTRVKKERVAGENKDVFGLRKGSKASQAAAMFARAKGATMADVKEALGAGFYNLLNGLAEAGHKFTKDGHTYFLTAK